MRILHGTGNVGVPIKLLFEAEGMKVTVEMKNGEIYRGLLVSAEETMNMILTEVIRTARNGHISKLPNVYLRGSGVRFIALPDLLKNAPCFQKVTAMKRKAEEAQRQKQQEGAYTFILVDVYVFCCCCHESWLPRFAIRGWQVKISISVSMQVFSCPNFLAWYTNDRGGKTQAWRIKKQIGRHAHSMVVSLFVLLEGWDAMLRGREAQNNRRYLAAAHVHIVG